MAVRRMVYIALGLLSTGLAALGAILPGLPTTIFVIGASYCFTRSSPRLEQALRANRLFGPALRQLAENGGAMPRRAKSVALLAMWTGIAISMVALSGSFALQMVALTLGLIGTGVILLRVPTLHP